MAEGVTKVTSLVNNDSAVVQNGVDDDARKQGVNNRRCKLPAPMIIRSDVNLWSILKQCVGKELSKITMPVVFNEPLSFLQRVVEYMAYADLLRKASESFDVVERLEYVTAFAVSAASSNWQRLGKPFNPLLGETYELDSDDIGFRIVTEQVSHHPPVSAFHAESDLYTFHGAVHPKLKFWGKSVEITPKGYVTLHLLKHNEVYTWQNVNCSVNNIMVGKLWLELFGTMEVVNHKLNLKAVVTFKQCGWFGKDLHKVEGYIYDKNKVKLRAFYGKWVEGFYSHDVDAYENYLKNYTGKSDDHQASSSQANNKKSNNSDKIPDEVPTCGSTCDLCLPGQRLLWHSRPRPKDSEKYYNFTTFAMTLNELDDVTASKLAPTDSRLRPDIRFFEQGDIDGAAVEKSRLEEKQRMTRKERKKRKVEWKPKWFKPGNNPHTDKEDWMCTGEYWLRNWARSPEIF